jgi:Domain of unknown function (DU1801)
MPNKTQPTKVSVKNYVDSIKDPKRKADCEKLVEMMSVVSGEKPILWGASIVGFGQYEYQYASGRTGQWMKIGFSSRKDSISLYLACYWDGEMKQLLKELGPHKLGMGCLYVKRLSDIKLPVLKKLMKMGYKNNFNAVSK